MVSEQVWSFTTGVAGLAGVAPVTIQAAPVAPSPNASKRLWITGIQIRNGANAGSLTITDDAGAGTVLWSTTLAASEFQSVAFPRPLVGFAGNLKVTGGAAGGGAIVNVQGFIY